MTANSAGQDGAGVMISNAHVVLLNNTIADQADGDALVFREGSTVIVQNNVITGNRGGIVSQGSNQFVLERNDVWANLQNYQAIPFHSTDLNVDPLFVNAAGGAYYLSQITAGQAVTSPLVDAGTSQALAVGLADFTTRSDGIPDSGLVDLDYHDAPATAANLTMHFYMPLIGR